MSRLVQCSRCTKPVVYQTTKPPRCSGCGSQAFGPLPIANRPSRPRTTGGGYNRATTLTGDTREHQ